MLRKLYSAAIPACLYMKFCIYERPGTFLVKLRTLYPYPCQLNYTQKKKKGSQSGCSIHPTSIMVFCRRQNILCNLFQGPHPHGRTARAIDGMFTQQQTHVAAHYCLMSSHAWALYVCSLTVTYNCKDETFNVESTMNRPPTLLTRYEYLVSRFKDCFS